MSEMEIRGAGVQSMFVAIDALYGVELRERALDATPPAFAQAVRARRISASTWVPIAHYRALLHALIGCGLSLADLHKLGHASASHDLNTIYRLVFKALPCAMVARQTPRFFGIYYRGGDPVVLESGPDFCRIHYRNCQGFDRLVWTDYTGGATAVMELTGAKNLEIAFESGGDGPEAIARAKWE